VTTATVGPAPGADIAALGPDAVYDALGTAPGGLEPAEADRRLGTVGPNRIEEVVGPPLLARFAANFVHLMALLLWVAGGIALLAGLPELAVAVWVVNIINGVFSFSQEYKAERATEALRRLLPANVRVLRGGLEATVLAEQLVPGDVLVLAEGDRISADGRIVEEHELRVDQSTLTGKSHPSRRTAEPVADTGASPAEQRNRVFAGTSVVAGRAKAVVTATGMRTEFGALARMSQTMEVEQSPLQRELARLTRVVAVIAVAAGLLFFVVAELFTPMGLTRGLVFALGMIVAFVPEGILPTVTLALAMATQRMAGRQALVKRLSAVEALGSATVICTDKTGTLTANAMTVRVLRTPDGRYELTGAGYAPVGDLLDADGRLVTGRDDVRWLLLGGVLANDARLLEPDDEGGRSWSVLGDPTEGALVVAAAKVGLDAASEAGRRPRVDELPFDSARRRMSTVHRDGSGRVLFCKGAPLDVLARCTHQRIAGRVEPLGDGERAALLDANDELGRDALRVLAVAMRSWPADPGPLEPDELESGLVFLGLVAMMDPPRPEVAAAVQSCHRAGIRIVMITGDYGLTAESVARRIGIVDRPGVRVVNGDELETLDDEALAAVLADEVIFARTAPAQKLRVVAALQGLGHVVAVTGDGVDDAPALKRADIGVAMGRSGTDVAREAADMILLDDNFASIVAAVEEGRAVYANIRKFTGYIFTSNTPEAVPFLVYGLSGGRVPIALGVMPILAVDLGTDLGPALALGGEPPEPGTMDRPPRPVDEHLVSRALLVRSYLWLGLAQAAVVMAAFYARYWIEGYWGQWLDLPDEGTLYASATAMAFAAVVFTQIGNLLAHRTERASLRSIGLWSNPLVRWGILSELAVVAAVVYLPPLQSVIGTAGFPLVGWALLVPAIPLLLIIDEIRKAGVRRRATDGGAR